VLKQERENRNVTENSLDNEKKNIDMLNEALGDIELTQYEERSLLWLSGWELSTVKNIISAFKKAKGKL